MIDSNAALRAWADSERETPSVRAPCATCGGSLGDLFDRALAEGCWSLQAEAAAECPCTDGLAPRVGPEIDLTPRRECEVCPTCPLCCGPCLHDPAPCPAQCDDGWLGWDGDGSGSDHSCAICGFVPIEGMAEFMRIHGDTATCTRCKTTLPNIGPPDLTPILKPVCGGCGPRYPGASREAINTAEAALKSGGVPDPLSKTIWSVALANGPLCPTCSGTGHGPPLVDVLPVRVDNLDTPGPIPNESHYRAKAIKAACAEFGVTLEVREAEEVQRDA